MGLKTESRKGIDIFCTSPASTAVCKATISKPLNRLNSFFSDRCIADLPLTPRRKSSADVLDLRRKTSSDVYKHRGSYTSLSSRYLLDSLPSDSEYHSRDDSLALLPMVPTQPTELRRTRSHAGRTRPGSLPLPNPRDQRLIKSNHARIKESSVPPPPPPPTKHSLCAALPDQVVALRVSLHCKACEAKLRKHLSKMEGVSSFSIDMQTKKVTIIGKVRASDVLTSISKVKNAQFWPSPISASSSTSSSSSSSTTSSSSSNMKLRYIQGPRLSVD